MRGGRRELAKVDFDKVFDLVLTIYYENHEEQLVGLEKLFMAHDKNTDDVIDLEEFGSAVKVIFPNIDGLEVASMYDRVMAVADDNEDGCATHDAAALAFSSVMMEYIGREERAVGGGGQTDGQRRKKVQSMRKKSASGDAADAESSGGGSRPGSRAGSARSSPPPQAAAANTTDDTAN